MTLDVVLSKLESLSRILERLESRKHLTAKELECQLDDQDVVILNLERAVQICSDLAALICSRKLNLNPTTTADSFRILAEAGLIHPDLAEKMRKAVGFRNLAVHEYSRINFQIVANILSDRLDDFRSFARAMHSLPL